MTVYIAEAATSAESSDWVRMTIPCPRCGQVHAITCASLRPAIDDLTRGRECRCGATLLDGTTDGDWPGEQPTVADVEYLREELQIFKGVAHELGGIVQGVVDALGIRRDAERDVVLAELGRRLLPAASHQGATTDVTALLHRMSDVAKDLRYGFWPSLERAAKWSAEDPELAEAFGRALLGAGETTEADK